MKPYKKGIYNSPMLGRPKLFEESTKILIQLEANQAKVLKEKCKELGITVTDIIRDLIKEFIKIQE